ncbi:hypothetical protein [Xenorhabdus griffiniae]|uniref:Uncharacterized protein n=1 Tax=Xenorhabdus griffiniae TaxID=351672 RepID=A0ABY9XG90_9GAMM|nr:hypothetical protein [Xenorhabdus griffiniae]MBD1229179.1 hypothetical protein [Xenorhabdus griffiniae]MBE8586577.1 hypothetical protein [Xenorhabdus griffiniae]WMV71953.1 hypothetical protein QL128_17810 [Xenorhabdus griffiniae]WNH01630.1 hypothetical protein QL112_017815 [Xenorhabdus griffiniae]
MRKSWTIEEDCKLLTLVRQHFSTLARHERLNATMPFSQQLHTAFASPDRDAPALLFRLKDAGILGFAGQTGVGPEKQPFRCLINNDLVLYDYSLTFPTLRKALHPDTVAAALNHFTVSNPHEPLSDTISEIATDLHLAPMQVEKVLIESGQITINSYRKYERTGEKTIDNNLKDLISSQTPDAKLIEDINTCRARASQLYHVHERDGAEVIFSSDGTGFGKSYGVIQGYVEYLERFAKTQKPGYLFPEGGFTNLLFISPQKSQIDLDSSQKNRIQAVGGEFICVLARKDIADLDFMDWASGLKNRDRYIQWYEGAKGSALIKVAMRSLNYLVSQVDRCEEQLEKLATYSSQDTNYDREMLEEQLKNCRHSIRNTIESACKSLFGSDSEKTSIKEYIHRGLLARRKRELNAMQGKPSSKMSVHEVYFELIKQVLPFEVCQYRPSVLLMTTNKFDTSTYRLAPRQRGEGVRFESVGFDLLVGGKLKPEDPQISTVAATGHARQVAYLRDEHFRRNPGCPFRRNNIRFTVIIDELHEAYTRLEETCHVKLVKQENNLAHVISVTGRIHNAVCSLEHRNKPKEAQTTFEQEMVKFIATLRELLEEKCELSSGVTLGAILEMFRDQLGAFEVNGDAAERIISITRNVFSFNAKMYVNEEGLKRIRMRNSEGDITRTELYYEVENDTSDTNPTLHDLFQLVSVILVACAQITNRHFKRWVKNGGQDNSSSQNTPLGQFVDAANNVAGVVRHIFDRTTDENLLIDHFYTYLQPKTVFTMTPVAELNYVNAGAERTIILAFEMDLVQELPEAMLLRLLTGTHNKVVGLSATSGFSHTKNGNFSRHFLERYSHDLGYRVVEREMADIDMLKELRKLRARIRDVKFKVFDDELPALTDIHQNCEIFRKVYNDFFKALKEPLENTLKNPYKQRQYHRELEALLLAAYEGRNSLILSLSGGFKRAFIRAWSTHRTAWRQLYGMKSQCDEKTDNSKKHDQILTFTPFPERHTIRLVFFDSPLANIEDIKSQTYIDDSNTVLVFMSTYNSAGTGLNYFVKYHDGNINDTNAPRLDVDFQRLVLINSSYYSEVKGNGANFNTLPNYVTVLKHYADDDIAVHKLADFSVNFAQGENYRLLMAEHDMSLFKVAVQAVGRVERRDTLLKTEIFLPRDVFRNVAFQFAALSEDSGNEVVSESMSLLNHRLMEECEKLIQSQSFSDKGQRHTFEQAVIANGRRIDTVHKRVLKTGWINQVRAGNLEYLELCNLFRAPESFTNPERWLAKLQANPLYAANRQMQSIHNVLFIHRQQDNQTILLCHKRGPDGLAHSDYSALSDFVGGAREYRPELTIFPQYRNDVYSGNLVGELIRECARLQETAFEKWVPNPMLVPLLKGNVGEYLFDKVLKNYGVAPLSDQQVFERLEPLVYEFFDRFIEVGDDLICVDVKRWATHLDDLTRAEEALEKSSNKIRQIRNIASQKADTEGQKQLQAALAGRYECIRFVYLNVAYSQNPNNLMWQDNADHTIHYLNLFQTDYQYYQPKNRESGRPLEKSKLGTTLDINPMLQALLGIEKLPTKGKFS